MKENAPENCAYDCHDRHNRSPQQNDVSEPSFVDDTIFGDHVAVRQVSRHIFARLSYQRNSSPTSCTKHFSRQFAVRDSTDVASALGAWQAVQVMGRLSAKDATSTTPIVFMIGSDPVELGLVKSFNRPGGNLTGVAYLNVEVAPRRLELQQQVGRAARAAAQRGRSGGPGARGRSCREGPWSALAYEVID